MKKLQKKGLHFLCIIMLLVGCSLQIRSVRPGPVPDSTEDSPNTNLSREQFSTLKSIQLVDHYPLYMMTYSGEYPPHAATITPTRTFDYPDQPSSWACSLFTVLLDQDHYYYGRNFDWQYSPALLLFTDPPDGYASVSMVDITYLGFDGPSARRISDLPINERVILLDAPYLPFDGMNEYGLAIGMAAVPGGTVPFDERNESIGSLAIIRKILDGARTVDEAVDIMNAYNIVFKGGPPIHYLIADTIGKAVLVEYYGGEMHVFTNDHPWHLATNFLRSSEDNLKDSGCWRYNKMNTYLNGTYGSVDLQSALQLLEGVAQKSTQWSVLYQMSSGTISVVMGRQYQNVHTFQLDLAVK